MSAWARAPRASKWTRWGTPTGFNPPPRAIPLLKPVEPLRDEFGLLLSVYGRFPRDVRRYVAIGLKSLNLSYDEHPQVSGFGTIPEVCFYGALIERGFSVSRDGFVTSNPRTFIYQSKVLGGRVPGGAVADFVIYEHGLITAVRVQSVYHAETNPFGSGGEKAEEDRTQEARLESQGWLTGGVVDVNLSSMGNPLETGTQWAIQRDVRRALHLE
jgi:hypothetical protein